MEEKMKFSLNLLDKNIDINKLILNNLKHEVEKIMSKALTSIKQDVQNLVKEALIAEPEYTSLKAGTLRAEFGIANVEDVDSAVQAMVNTAEISYNPIKINSNGLSGGFVLTMIKSDDINGIIYSDVAIVKDEARGYNLPWLEWLLLRGNEVIVQNYSVNYTSNPRSRSGLALMIQSNSSWRVPSNFAGTEADNWTTRAINKISNKIPQIIQSNIENYL